MVEHPNSNSTQPSRLTDAPNCIKLWQCGGKGWVDFDFGCSNVCISGDTSTLSALCFCPLPGMLENFSRLIDKYGFIPNGNRVYFERRSQPPLFASMAAGMNCIKIVLPGKSILGDYFQEDMTSRRPFLSLRISFPGRPIFIQWPQSTSTPPMTSPSSKNTSRASTQSSTSGGPTG